MVLPRMIAMNVLTHSILKQLTLQMKYYANLAFNYAKHVMVQTTQIASHVSLKEMKSFYMRMNVLRKFHYVEMVRLIKMNNVILEKE